MTIDKTIDLLSSIFDKEERTVMLLLGAPGGGKTSAVSEAAKQAGIELMTLALPTCEAVDLRGIPHIEESSKGKKTSWASPLPKSGRGVLLLDELTSAPKDVQVAAHHIVWSERGSDMCLPKGWHVVLTGNRAQDRTAYQAVAAPLRNRMTIVNIEPNVSVWRKWALAAGIEPSIIGFLEWRPELLSSKEIPADGAFPSPRAWEMASRLIQLSGTDAQTETELLSGTIGEGATVEFSAYLRLARELPQVQSILANPDKSEVPTSPEKLYAIVSALSVWARENKSLEPMRYICRVPAEYGMLFIRDVRDQLDIRNDKFCREWVAKHKKIFRED